MAVDRNLWRRSFLTDDVPVYPCPNCARGHLHPTAEALHVEEPRYSSKARADGDWEPEWITERFSMRLVCDIQTCGEIVNLVGETGLVEYIDEETGDQGLVSKLVPKGMFPPPAIISLPEDTPFDVAQAIKTSFALYWVDTAACANRIRVSVERLLNAAGVPSVGKMTKGRPRDLTLFDRIEAFKQSEPDHAITLDALRIVGNLGSHDGRVNRDTILDAYEIYEHALAELIGKRSKMIDTIRRKLIADKKQPPAKKTSENGP